MLRLNELAERTEDEFKATNQQLKELYAKNPLDEE